MLRYTTGRTRPGLVALYGIRLGNGAGQLLQPRSPHRPERSTQYWLTFTGYQSIINQYLLCAHWAVYSKKTKQETPLSLTNRATCLEVSQGHQTIQYVRCGFLLVCYSNFVPKYSTSKNVVSLKPRLGVTRGH